MSDVGPHIQGRGKPPLRDRDVPSREAAVEAVIRQMKRSVNDVVTLDDWADYASLSKYQLMSAFRELTGITPMAFHSAEKLEIAKYLLVFEDMKVTDVCFELGFESLGSFVSKFSIMVGLPPGNYARIMRATNLRDIYASALANWRGAPAEGEAAAAFTFERPPLTNMEAIVAAVFKRPAPVGYPSAWRFVAPLQRRTTMSGATGGCCLAASVPLAPTLANMVNFRPTLVGRSRLARAGRETHVSLRAPTVFDPPVTLAIPALLCHEAGIA